MTNHIDASSSSPSSPASDQRSFAPRPYRGGCVCGAVRFEATIDFSVGTTRCNCSLCTKASLWSVAIKPENFTLLTSEDHLVDFQRLGKFGHFLFCKHCGVRSFGRGDAPWMGGKFVQVHVNCLEDADLAGVEIRHYDGLHDDWQNPRVERYRG